MRILLIILALVVSLPCLAQSRDRGVRHNRRDNYRIQPRARSSYHHTTYRGHDRGRTISKDLRRVAYGVGIVSDIVGIYNDIKYPVVETGTVSITTTPVVYQQQQPIVVIEERRCDPVIIYRNDYRIVPRHNRVIIRR